MEGAATGMSALLTAASTILTGVLGLMTSLTEWVIGDDLAIMFFGFMIILFGVKLVLTLIKNAA